MKTLGLILLLLALPGFNNPEAQYPRIIEWVEDAPANDADRIALGYPVPIPVDTPLPFDGFRSYNGLHARHQDLAETTDLSHGFEIGQTRLGSTIWAYQLGDADHLTAYGVPEHAMLTNGGIHAREWQTPEVATGIIELLAASEDDHHLVSYLRDNANVLVIPVLNVDGFRQTQRYPSLNWIDTDPGYPETWPRDGRMRRKNMLGVDENLYTQGDHLFGVDLNRNNAPYWSTNPERSSDQPESLVHHGESAASEPETQALDAAAQLGPASMLSMFTDLHSYGLVQFWTVTENEGLANLTSDLLNTFTNHHFAFDANKYYWSDTIENVAEQEPIGSTDEYFAETYQVPAWILEIEPSGGNHQGLPGQGADYGGLARNTHDGFILPDSEVQRVRTELAQTFAVAYYQQSGPPSIVAMRLVDDVTMATVFEAEWDVTDEVTRNLYTYQAQPVQLDRVYHLWLALDKPMRWRESGEVTVLPGQPQTTLDVDLDLRTVLGGTQVNGTPLSGAWLDEPGEAPGGYLRYRDDSLSVSIILPIDTHNEETIVGPTDLAFSFGLSDMTGAHLDADPSTVAHWHEGGWSGYEDADGTDRTNTGGIDDSIQFEATSEVLGDPFVIEAGTSSAWYGPSHDGEGFVLEILANNRAVMFWFTYDTEGNQDWYTAVGRIRGNRILFPRLIKTSGGVFGPEFDPESVVRTVVGSASFIWSDCDSGAMDYLLDKDGNGRRHGRMELHRITSIMGLECGQGVQQPDIEEGWLSGSWYDPSHDGEGYVLEILADHRALVFWFSYDAEANLRWFFGTGRIEDGRVVFNNLRTTRGGLFGPDFDPASVERIPWGTLELDLECSSGVASFTSSEEGFPAGTLNVERLTALDGLVCEN